MALTIRSTFRRSLALLAGAALIAGSAFDGVGRACAGATRRSGWSAPHQTLRPRCRPLAGAIRRQSSTPAPPAPATLSAAGTGLCRLQRHRPQPPRRRHLPLQAARRCAPVRLRSPISRKACSTRSSTSRRRRSVKDEGDGPHRRRCRTGSPFQEFFNDFFKDKGSQSSNHKVSSLGSGFVIDPDRLHRHQQPRHRGRRRHRGDLCRTAPS